MQKSKFMLAAAMAIALATPALAIDDTPANRAAQAQAYLATVDIKTFWLETALGMLGNMPADQRQQAVDQLGREDVGRVRTIMTDALVQVYSADELAAMAQFYGSPIGRSVLAKTQQYYAAMSPALIAEVRRALGMK